MSFSKGFTLLTCLVGVLVPAGCSKQKSLPAELGEPLPVEGKVYVGDKPLLGGLIRFHPVEHSEQVLNLVQGQIDGQGNYFIQTYHPYPEKGAVAGKYKVSIEPSSNDRPQDGMVQGKYRNDKTTPLEVTVQKDAPPGTYDIKIEVRKKEVEAAIKKDKEKQELENK